MPRVKPLTAFEAKHSLAHRRFAGTPEKRGIADKIRQLNTKLGIRPNRVFLVWTQFSGVDRGEGAERELARVELLPTPKVQDLTSIALNPYSAGKLPVGSVRIDEISAGAYTADQLKGLKIPGLKDEYILPPNVSFFIEMYEDGRGDPEPVRMRYRVMAGPFRNAGNVCWTMILDRASEDESREGHSNIGVDKEQDDFR